MNYYNSKWDRWFVIGIAGRANSDNCRMKSSSINANKRPNIFIRVRSHLDLIHEHSGVMPPVIKERAPQTSRAKNRMRSTTTEIPITSATGSKSANSLLMTVSFNCKGKPPGNYPNPTVSCSTDFFMCSDYNSYLLVRIFIRCILKQIDLFHTFLFVERIDMFSWIDLSSGC